MIILDLLCCCLKGALISDNYLAFAKQTNAKPAFHHSSVLTLQPIPTFSFCKMPSHPSSSAVPFRQLNSDPPFCGQLVCFRNCRLFRNGAFAAPADELWVLNGKVVDAQKMFYGERRSPDLVVDCEHLVLAPAFLDLQVNGAFGVDFTRMAMEEKDADGVELVAQKLLQFGVTAFCPTLVTGKPAGYRNFLQLLKRHSPAEGKPMARVLGAHFEGPFISPHRAGCHPQAEVIPSLYWRSIESIYGSDLSRLAYVTVAPELPGALETIGELRAKGIHVSIGHSDATLEQALSAVEAGANCITHLFNAMRPFTHRDPGILGALSTSRLFYGLIADGIHVSEAALQLAHCANRDGTILVTDCISALGLREGIHTLSDLRLRVDGAVARLEDKGTFAGSISPMPHCVREFAKAISKLPWQTSNGLAEALRAATLNPAEFLGVADQLGTLRVDSGADFVLLDDHLEVLATFVGGVKCYQA